MKKRLAVIGALAVCMAAMPTARAQYTADYQTNTISGVFSNWSGDYLVGSNTFADVLMIQNGGVLTNVSSDSRYCIGYEVNSSNNAVLVTGSGSIWSGRSSSLYVGLYGGGNSLVISNGGQVGPFSEQVLGYGSNSCNNSVLVTGAGSVFNTGSITFGRTGAHNSVIVSDGGRINSILGCLGQAASSSNNSVLVTGTGSVWKIENNYFNEYQGDHSFPIGFRGPGNSLVISNGGQVLGWFSLESSNNTLVITGPGSFLGTNAWWMGVGYGGSFNAALISVGGTILSSRGYVGYFGTNNTVLLTDGGSMWTNVTYFDVGAYGSGNSLVISNGGQVIDNRGSVGRNGSNNNVRVVDGGVWQNQLLYVGEQGFYGQQAPSNRLVIVGGTVLAANVTIGLNTATCDNWIELDSGSIYITNATADAVLEVRSGKFILNGGVLQVDKLVITNACARFIWNGGTLIAGSVLLDPNMDADGDGIPNGWEQAHGLDPLNFTDANIDSDGDGFTNLQEYLAGTDPTTASSTPFRITAIALEGDDIRITWATVAGTTNALQAAAGDNGSYTNTFADIFTVTNTIGTVTNYLDAGAATNVPSRFYRVRLVP